jgi:hypothetical protein
MSYPKVLNIHNIKYFFDFKSTSTGLILPGMIIQFNYRSPDGVHAVKPLVYVLEAEQDRIWGMNLHYKLSLLGDMVDLKKEELSKGYPLQPIAKPVDPKEAAKVLPSQLNQKHVPSLPETKDTLKDKISQPQPEQKRAPQKLLEHFTITNPPKHILRNYLYPRMSGVTKLIFKQL